MKKILSAGVVLVLTAYLFIGLVAPASAEQGNAPIQQSSTTDFMEEVLNAVARQAGWPDSADRDQWFTGLLHTDIFGDLCSGGGGRTPSVVYYVEINTNHPYGQEYGGSTSVFDQINVSGVTANRETEIDLSRTYRDIQIITWQIGNFFIKAKMNVWCPMDTPVSIDVLPLAQLVHQVALEYGMDTWPNNSGSSSGGSSSGGSSGGDDDYDNGGYYSDPGGDDDYYYDDSGDFLDILMVGGGLIVLGGGTLGGGYLGYRLLRNRLGRRAIKAAKPILKPIPKPAPIPAPAPQQIPPRQLERNLDRLGKDIDRLLKKYNQPFRDEIDFYQRQAKIFERKEAVIDTFDSGTRTIKFVNDQAADLIGHFPGAGQKFRWGYHGVTKGIMKTIETGSIRKGFYEGFKEAGKKFIGDKVTDRFIRFSPIKPRGSIREIGKKSTFFGRIKRGLTRTVIEKPIKLGKKLLKLLWR